MKFGTEFKEHSKWRYCETLAGLFWILILPAIIVIIVIKAVHSQFSSGEITCLVFAFIAMALLEFAAVKIFIEGLYGFYRHKKTAIIIYDDCIEFFFSSKKFKTNMRTVNYNDIRNFYVVSEREAKGSSFGKIFFDIADEKKYFSATIYNAKTAAELILAKLDFEQIDHANNEVKKL